MYYLCYALLYCIIFAFGAAIGSFLNVCIYRLPKEESLWRNNSHCMTCGTPIPETGSDPDFQLVPAQGKMPQLRRKDPVPLYAGGESERRAVRADLRILRHL